MQPRMVKRSGHTRGAEEVDRPAARSRVGTSSVSSTVLALQRTIGNQATTRLLQRTFSTRTGPEAGNRDILKEVARGTTQLGYTFPVLNGERVHSTSEIFGKLKAPEVEVTPIAEGTFRGKVSSVGDNVGSYDLEYVDPGQKSGTQALTRGELAIAVESLRKILGGLTLVTEDDVDDLRRESTRPASLAIKTDFQELANQTLIHERRHGSDHLAVYKEILGRWDRTLEAARSAGQKPRVKADDVDGATDELWKLVGGDPLDIARRVWTEMVRRSNAFHSTPEGAEARVNSIGWTKESAKLEIELEAGPRGQGELSLTTPLKSVKDKPLIEIIT